MASRYVLTCDLQKNDKESKLSREIVRDMHSVSKQLLEMFRHTNCWRYGIHPNKIIVFRDGLTEDEFQHALDYEVDGIQRASYDIFQKIIPITYISVEQRLRSRSYTVNTAGNVGSFRNIPSGTANDGNNIHPAYFGHYLVSEEGTSKPIHCTVLHNDNNFKVDDLRQLSHFLCHTYVPCSQNVFLPAPVLYANVAAYRAKKYADLHIPPVSAIKNQSRSRQQDLPPYVVKAIQTMKSFRNNMYYI